MKITTLTAEHVLSYLLASEGLETPYGPLLATWPIFKQFLALPSEANPDLASVQLGFAEADQRVVQLIFARQLTDEAGGYGLHGRAILLTYLWELAEPLGIEAFELWSDDFPDRSSFYAAVEGHPAFQRLSLLPPEEVTVATEALEEDGD